MAGTLLSPSLLSADFSCLAGELAALEEAGVSWAHWDVMDGMFVPNITMGPAVIAACRKESTLFFDVHLMIERPGRFIEQFVDAGADILVSGSAFFSFPPYRQRHDAFMAAMS